MSFKIVVGDVSEQIKAAVVSMATPVKGACTRAIIEAGSKLAVEGAADIAANVKGRKFPAGWHVRFYQVQPPQISAAAWAYHKIPWASVFESGSVQNGRPWLWIPLRNAPRFFGGGNISPKKLYKQGVKLFPIFRAGKVPLLATKVFATTAERRRLNTDITSKRILSGRQTDQGTKKEKLNRQRVTVPLFFGMQTVTLRKRFHIGRLAQAQRDALPGYYENHLNPDDR